jgi:hypothetical protein
VPGGRALRRVFVDLSSSDFLHFIIETHSLPNARSLLPSQLYLSCSSRSLDSYFLIFTSFMSLDTQTKLAIYRHFAETGQRPLLEVVAERVGSDVSSVREVYDRLRAQRVLVLEPDGVSIRMAPPFSGVPTQHVVIVDQTKYFANCAWDSFGIPAALHRPGRVHSRCEQSGEPLSLEIGLEGPPPFSWLFHCLVPAAKWWDDIVFT